MNDVVKKWVGGDSEGYTFWCPGCDKIHSVWTKNDGSSWSFNGDTEKPTFSPSILVRWPAKPEASEKFKEWNKERICHSFVTNGQIQFLSDCTHEKANQTVPLPLLSTWRYE